MSETDKNMPDLKTSDLPRLYVGADIVKNLQSTLHSPHLKTLAERVIRDAGQLVNTAPLREGGTPTYQAGTRAIDNLKRFLAGEPLKFVMDERRYALST